jgi:uncharacterized protein (DUF1786 family)
MSEKKKVRCAWFSAEQAKKCGTVFYEKLEGGEVEVTCVSSDGNHGCQWPDMVFMGEVLDFKRRGQRSTLFDFIGPSFEEYVAPEPDYGYYDDDN